MRATLMRNDRCRRRQRGAALMVGMVILVLISILGISAYWASALEERMSGNARERLRAFESAEAALRNCESVLAGASLPAFDGTGGMYTAQPITSPQVYQTINWNSATATRVIDPSGPAPMTSVSRQPACIVEQMITLEEPGLGYSQQGGQEMREVTVYRVTARGYGSTNSSTVTLQTVYRR